ncbi:unnamed protein product [Microthlaspi erraticum]|uniref:RRM domain-containing protein n=1 Tax=Microthlaspi erraticum TaxID=1685480 RepID=A0A6D2IWW4_9BRAS|nr:unnamed protein product [Microthlaspi erraticum]
MAHRNPRDHQAYGRDHERNSRMHESIKELLLRGINTTIHTEDISDKLVAYGEIESIAFRFLDERGWAFVTYTTREGAEKAMQELSGSLVINGQRLKLAWGNPEVHNTYQDVVRTKRALWLRVVSYLIKHQMGPRRIIASKL